MLQTVGAKTKIEHFRSDQKSAFESSKGVLIMAGSIYPPPGHEPPPRNSLPYDQGVLRETNGLYSVWYMFFLFGKKSHFWVLPADLCDTNLFGYFEDPDPYRFIPLQWRVQ